MGGLVGAVILVGAGIPRAVAEDDDEKSFDKKIRDNFMSALGIKAGPDIDYRERSPLVLPPRIDLPPPQADATTRPLRPSELNVGDRQRSRTPGGNQEQMDGRNRPSDLGYKGGILGSLFGSKEETAQFTSEPPRTSLIEPPVGYQTPSPDQPYAPGREKSTLKIPSFFDFGTAQK
jgi:hypothetical protein